MNCDHVLSRACDYFEHRLPADVRAEVDAHVAGCPSCGEFWTKALEIKCREFTEFLDDYVELRLAPERRRIFERHLSICPMCLDYLSAYETTLRVTKASAGPASPDAPAELPPQLVQAIVAAMRKTT